MEKGREKRQALDYNERGGKGKLSIGLEVSGNCMGRGKWG